MMAVLSRDPDTAIPQLVLAAQAGHSVRVAVQGLSQVELLQLLLVSPDTDYTAGAGCDHQLGVGTDTGQDLTNQVVRLTDEDCLVRVVGAQSE